MSGYRFLICARHVIYVTSQSIATAIVDYYLHLLPGIPDRKSVV